MALNHLQTAIVIKVWVFYFCIAMIPMQTYLISRDIDRQGRAPEKLPSDANRFFNIDITHESKKGYIYMLYKAQDRADPLKSAGTILAHIRHASSSKLITQMSELHISVHCSAPFFPAFVLMKSYVPSCYWGVLLPF